MKLTCYDIANYFLAQMYEEAGDLMSNLNLQKLVYYAQGLRLVLTGVPLFGEDIRAWAYGPVVPELYYAYKKYNSGSIPSPTYVDFSVYSQDVKDFLDEVYMVFGQFSAKRLMELSHSDQCWKEAYPNGIITHKAMQEILKKYIKNEIINLQRRVTMKYFIFFKDDSTGLRIREAHTANDLRKYLRWAGEKQDEEMYAWMETAKIGELFNHDLGYLVRLIDSEE